MHVNDFHLYSLKICNSHKNVIIKKDECHNLYMKNLDGFCKKNSGRFCKKFYKTELDIIYRNCLHNSAIQLSFSTGKYITEILQRFHKPL